MSAAFLMASGCLFSAALTSASAEEVEKPSVRPGDVLHFKVHLEGEDSNRFSAILVVLSKVAYEPNSLTPNIPPSWSSKADGVFNVTISIPPLTPAGDYELSATVAIQPGGPQFGYTPTEIKSPKIHIVDDVSLRKPSMVISPLQVERK